MPRKRGEKEFNFSGYEKDSRLKSEDSSKATLGINAATGADTDLRLEDISKNDAWQDPPELGTSDNPRTVEPGFIAVEEIPDPGLNPYEVLALKQGASQSEDPGEAEEKIVLSSESEKDHHEDKQSSRAWKDKDPHFSGTVSSDQDLTNFSYVRDAARDTEKEEIEKLRKQINDGVVQEMASFDKAEVGVTLNQQNKERRQDKERVPRHRSFTRQGSSDKYKAVRKSEKVIGVSPLSEEGGKMVGLQAEKSNTVVRETIPREPSERRRVLWSRKKKKSTEVVYSKDDAVLAEAQRNDVFIESPYDEKTFDALPKQMSPRAEVQSKVPWSIDELPRARRSGLKPSKGERKYNGKQGYSAMVEERRMIDDKERAARTQAPEIIANQNFEDSLDRLEQRQDDTWARGVIRFFKRVTGRIKKEGVDNVQ